eukprot:3307294-Prorocentrum_lima.AAC.1
MTSSLVGSEMCIRDSLLTTLKKHYGEDAKVETHNVEHSGIKHEQDPLTGHVYTHQDHYVLELSE